jgi:chromosome segregation ATPase
MKQEILNKLELAKTQITKEEQSYKELSPILEDVIGLKKKITIESLKKFQFKLENDLAKILKAEEKQKESEDKEKREAPIRELMAKINENNQIQKDLKAQLERAKALSRQDPKNQDALVDSFKLANDIGDVGRANAKLIEQQKELLASRGGK